MSSPANEGRALRVLHIYRTYFPDPPGGLQEAIRQIASATIAFGVESRVFTLSPSPEPEVVSRPEGQVIRCRSWGAPASCDIGGPASFRRFRLLAQWADVLHFHFPWPFGDLLRLLGDRKTPAVMTYHSDIVRQRYLGILYGPLMRAMLGSMDAVVATSPAYAQTSLVLAKYVAPINLSVIPLGVRDEFLADNVTLLSNQAELPVRMGLPNAPFFLSLGVLRYYKGLHTLIEAASTVDANFVIAGSGPEEDRLRALASSLGVSNVFFVGQVTEEEKDVLLRRCKALILPSHFRSEAFGMVLVEAAMYGRPMICCEIGSGTSYVNANGETGWVIPPENPEALAHAARSLINDDELTERMGKAARKRFCALFSEEPLGDAYSSLYRKVVK